MGTRLAVFVISLAAQVFAQQEPRREPAAPSPQQADAKALQAAIDAWVDSDQVDEALLTRTVAAVLDAKDGLVLLGERMRPTIGKPEEKASKGIGVLCLRSLLGFLERAQKSEMTFRGQYAPLRALEPYATKVLFELLLHTPDWFPHTQRDQLVPALRDLVPAKPDERRLEGIIDIVDNVDVEPAGLRLKLSCLLWEWGRKEYLIPKIDQLKQEAIEGDAEDRLPPLRALGQLWYEVAEYQKAAQVFEMLTHLAPAAKLPLTPTDWYWTACCHAMRGDVERGLAALEECARLQVDESTDASYRLPRRLFEQDPEIRLLRADARFARILDRAFPKPRGDASKVEKGD